MNTYIITVLPTQRALPKPPACTSDNHPAGDVRVGRRSRVRRNLLNAPLFLAAANTFRTRTYPARY